MLYELLVNIFASKARSDIGIILFIEIVLPACTDDQVMHFRKYGSFINY